MLRWMLFWLSLSFWLSFLQRLWRECLVYISKAFSWSNNKHFKDTYVDQFEDCKSTRQLNLNRCLDDCDSFDESCDTDCLGDYRNALKVGKYNFKFDKLFQLFYFSLAHVWTFVRLDVLAPMAITTVPNIQQQNMKRQQLVHQLHQQLIILPSSMILLVFLIPMVWYIIYYIFHSLASNSILTTLKLTQRIDILLNCFITACSIWQVDSMSLNSNLY